MQPPPTFEATRDEAAADAAREKATSDKAYATQLKAIQDAEAKAQTDALNRINQLAAGKEANTKITTLFEDMTAPRRILAKIGVAMGSLGGSLTGSPNYAQEMLTHEMDLDFKAKQHKAEQYMQEMQMAGALPAQIRQWGADAQEHALASQKAQLALIESHANTMLAPWPQAQRALQQTIADEKAKNGQNIANFVAGNTGVTSGSTMEPTTVSTTEGKGKSAGGGPKDNALALSAAAGKRDMDRLGQLTPPTPEELRTAHEAERAHERQESQELKPEGGGTSQFINEIGRQFSPGSFPETSEGEISESAKEYINIAKANATRLLTQQLGPRAAGNEKLWDRNMRTLVPYQGDSPEVIQRKAAKLGEGIADMEALANGTKAGDKLAAAAGGAPARPANAKPTTVQLSRLSPLEREGYSRAMMEKSTSPNYAKAQKVIKVLTAKALQQ